MRIKSENIINVLLHAVFLLLVYIFQAEVFARVTIFGCTPLLLPMAAVAVALMEGSGRGSVFGLFAGILCDLAFSRPVALFTVTLTVIAFVSGLLGETVMRRSFPSYASLCVATIVCVSFIQMFSLLFMEDTAPLPLLITAVMQLLVSIIFILPLYWFGMLLGRRVRTN